MNGLLVIDKPGGMTSREVVNRVQEWFPRRTKIGHTGTLDPLATGVLVVCVGHATRLVDAVQAMGKTYLSRFRLGATSSTDDADGEVAEAPEPRVVAEAEVRKALDSFLGDLAQVPPAVSALKVDGKRAHALARRGDAVRLSPRPVRVDAIRIAGYGWPYLDVEIDCGKGTYVRSIARDLGAKLGVGGMVQTLRRTRVGPFTAEQGIGLETTPEAVRDRLLPAAAMTAQMSKARVSSVAAKRFREGVLVLPLAIEEIPGDSPIAVFDESDVFVGLGVVELGGALRPVVILDRWA